MALTGDIIGTIQASMSASGGVNGAINFDGSGTDNYNELDNKPSINGVVLEGNKTSSDLHIESGGTDNYNELLNKPQINSVTLTGNVSDTQLQIDYTHLINKPDIPDISELENRVDTVESDISDINNDIIDISDDIATLKASDLVQNSDITSLKNRVTGAETNITNLTSRVSSAETSINNHSTEISNIESDITGLDTRVDDTEINITTLQGDMTQAQNDITELRSSIEIIGLTSTDIVTPASGVTMSARPCYKYGKEIFFTAVFSMSNPVNTANTLGTFKDGYRPNTQYYSIGMSYASGSDVGSASLVNVSNTTISVEHSGAKPYLVVCAKYITS